MITHKQGDMFTTDAYHLGHGVNLEGVMGAGVAKTVRAKFPAVYGEYRKTVLAEQSTLLPGGVLSVLSTWPGTSRGVWVHNLATQVLRGPHAELPLIQSAVAAMLQTVYWHGAKKVAIPRIGAGIGGLDWETEVLQTLEVASSLYPTIELEVWYL